MKSDKLSTSQAMGRIALRGSALVGGAQAFRLLATMISTVILARLLSPSDYGVVGMTAPITTFLILFQYFGLSDAAIQAEKLTDSHIKALMYFNITASVIIALVLVGISPLASMFYKDPRVGRYVAASASIVVVSGLSLQQTALLARQLRFGAIAAIEAATSVAILVFSVGTGVLWHNYWAIFAGQLGAACVTTVLAWTLSAWRPSGRFSLKGVGSMARFGGTLTGFQLLNFMSRNADNALIGRVWGAQQLGLYDVSYKIMLLPLTNVSYPLNRVMLPILARLRNEDDRYRRSFTMALHGIILITFPALAVAAGCSDQLIPFLLGAKWQHAAPIFFWLNIAGFFQPIIHAAGWLFISRQRGKELLHWGAVSATLLVTSFAVGVTHGAVGVAIAYCLAIALSTPAYLFWASRGTPIHSKDFVLLLVPHAIAAMAVAGLTALAAPYLSIVPLLLVALPAAYCLALAALATVSDGRGLLTLLFSTIRTTLGWKASTRGDGLVDPA